MQIRNLLMVLAAALMIALPAGLALAGPDSDCCGECSGCDGETGAAECAECEGCEGADGCCGGGDCCGGEGCADGCCGSCDQATVSTGCRACETCCTMGAVGMNQWFAVTGMSCAGCARSVASAIDAIEGVAFVIVDRESGEASVSLETGVFVAPTTVAAAINEAGFGATPVPVAVRMFSFERVSAGCCGGGCCSGATCDVVKNAVRAIAGVREVACTNETLVVWTDAEALDTDAIAAAVAGSDVDLTVTVKTESMAFSIAGLDDDDAIELLQITIEGIDGIETAMISAVTGEAVIEWCCGATNCCQLQAAITAAGFTIVTDGEPEATTASQQ